MATQQPIRPQTPFGGAPDRNKRALEPIGGGPRIPLTNNAGLVAGLVVMLALIGLVVWYYGF